VALATTSHGRGLCRQSDSLSEGGIQAGRDIIVALETDEEILDRDALGIQWLLKNRRDLIDAEFALNEGGGVGSRTAADPQQCSDKEKVSLSYQLEVRNRAATVRCRPGITRSTSGRGLVRLSKFTFPMKLNATTRAFFERMAQFEGEQIAAEFERRWRNG